MTGRNAITRVASLVQSSKPVAKSEAVSRAMRDMPESGTEPELRVRRLLFRAGLRYRVKYPVPGSPRRSVDIAFPGRKLAIFIDGCFWHGCVEHRNIPANNAGWWSAKFQQNRSRDEETIHLLEAAGWKVFRFWEHDDARHVLDIIQTFLKQ